MGASNKRWHDTVEQVKSVTDGLGMPVDKEIIETVAILRFIGLHTTMSCSGHAQRITGGPYVMSVSLKAERYREQCRQIGDPKNALYKKLYKKALKENLLEHQKLYSHLEQFYATRIVPYGQRLVFHTLGFSACRLDCQGAEQAYIRDRQVRKQIVLANQNEMREFTEYLKKLYL